MNRKTTDMTDDAMIRNLEDHLDALPEWTCVHRIETHKCATEGCQRKGCCQLTADDVSSDYCYECAGAISGWSATQETTP